MGLIAHRLDIIAAYRRYLAPLAITEMACASPEGVMEQEAAYMEALQSAAAYRVVENRLELEDAAGETTLVFAEKE